MKVDKIYQNYDNGERCKLHSHEGHNVNFAKKIPLDERILNGLPDSKAIQALRKFEWLKGEMGGILITAVGTGAVAPWPIAYNPFVKAPKDATPEEKEELKNTKKYTALRQPISALLAILFQVSALKPIDMVLDIVFNKPKWANDYFNIGIHFNQSEINGKSYIEKLAKNKIKKENPSLKGKAYDDLLAITKSEIENSQINNVAEKFKNTGNITVGKMTLDNKSLAELINKQIEEYINDAKALKIDNEGLAYYSERAKILMENEVHLKEIFKNAPNDQSKITDFVKNLCAKEKNPDVKILLEEILERPSDIQYSRISRTLDRIQNIKEMCGGKYTYEKYFEAMSTRNAKLDNIITDFMHIKIENPKSISNAQIKESMEKVIETCRFDKSDKLMNTILHDTNTFNFDKEKLANKVYKDTAKQYKDFVRNHYKGLNQVIKIIIGVCITLPITCNVLNWVYPRVMDKFFPKLAGAKKAQKEREGK